MGKLKKMSPLWKDAFGCTLFTCAIAGLFYLLFVNISFLDPFEKAFKDFSYTDLYYSKLQPKSGINSDIILVNAQHEDRFAIAQAISIIASEKPKAIGLDLIFKDLKTPFTDSILKAELEKHDNLVKAYFETDSGTVESHSYFKSAKENLGYINLDQEEAGVIREFVGIDDGANSFAVQLAKTAGYLKNDKDTKVLEASLPINYTRNDEGFLTVSISELLENQGFPAAQDAIVIFGYLGTPQGNRFDIEDKHFTPLNPKFAGKSVPDMYGVTVHANILNMIVKDGFIKRVPNFVTWILTLLGCLLCSYIGLRLHRKSEFLFDLLPKIFQFILAILLVYIGLLFIKSSIYINISIILLMCLLTFEMVEFYLYLKHYLIKRRVWKIS